MVEYDDMTPEERDRFIYLCLTEDALKAIVLIMRKRHGPDVSTDTIMRFAFKVARDRMTPKHLKKSRQKKTEEGKKSEEDNKTEEGKESGQPV